jgi:hypothetical protein
MWFQIPEADGNEDATRESGNSKDKAQKADPFHLRFITSNKKWPGIQCAGVKEKEIFGKKELKRLKRRKFVSNQVCICRCNFKIGIWPRV